MAVLSEVIDGTTWDSASDLTLKQVSDGLTAEHSSAGAHSAGVIDQAEVDFTSAGNQPGEAVRYDEFNAEHNASDGTHKSDIIDQAQMALSLLAAATGEAVRYDEFTQEHSSAGAHSANIIDQNEVNLTTAADQSGEAVRYDEFTQEHSSAGAHGNDIIDQAQMALTSAGAATGDATRYDEFSAQHTASTGAHRTDVEIISAQAQVNLGTAASVSGDAVRYDEYTTHVHSTYVCLYGQSAASTAENTDASALTSFSRSDATTNPMTAVRVAFYKRSDLDGLRLTGLKSNDSTSYDDAYVRLACSGQTADEQVLQGTTNADFELTLDISALTDDTVYEIDVQLRWGTAHAGGDKVTLTKPQVWAVEYGAAPA
jgi:hypothetical protein